MSNIVDVVARLLFAAIFIMSGIGHFTQVSNMSQYAASKGVPAAKFMVLLTGLMILLGGLSILTGYQTRIGGVLLIVFLLPTAFVMHNFWKVEDPMEKANQQAHFWKNLALAGAAYLIAFAG
ncbi:MAG: DoxX family protein [Calditrichaeota bacterium]|nr:MAG: DoxX family protein [Calditrichota bacterium]